MSAGGRLSRAADEHDPALCRDRAGVEAKIFILSSRNFLRHDIPTLFFRACPRCSASSSLSIATTCNMICDVCRDVIEAHVPKGVWSEEHRRDYYTPIWAHHLTCSSLKASVDKGCYICNRIWITLALEQQTYITGLAEQTQAAGVDELKLDNDEAPSSHTDFHTDIWKALKAVAHMKLSWHPDHQVEKLEIVGAFINIQQTYPPNMRPFDWNNSGIFLLQPYKGNADQFFLCIPRIHVNSLV